MLYTPKYDFWLHVNFHELSRFSPVFITELP